ITSVSFSFICLKLPVVCADLAINAKHSVKNYRPGIMPGDRLCRNASYGSEILAAEFLDRIREGFRGVLRGPRFLFVKNDLVHARAADPDHGRATSLALERDKPKRFLNPRVDKQLGGAIKAHKLDRISAVLDPF